MQQERLLVNTALYLEDDLMEAKKKSTYAEQSPGLRALAKKLEKELAEQPQDEGEIFSVLDILLFSLETEEKTFLSDLNAKATNSLIESLESIDGHLGSGLFRRWKILWYGPNYLEYLIAVAQELKKKLAMCNTILTKSSNAQIVAFIEYSGASYDTPVVRKWLETRKIKISQKEWKAYTKGASE